MKKVTNVSEEAFAPDNLYYSKRIGTLIINQDGNISSINRKAAELLGKEPHHLDNMPIMNYIILEDLERFEKYLKEQISRYPSLNNDGDIEVVLKGEKHAAITHFELVDTGHKEKCFVGIVKDIARLKELEERIGRHVQMNSEITEALRKEKLLSDLQTRFISMASHEFKTPLAGVLSSLQLIKRYLAAEQSKWDQFSYKGRIENHFDKIEESITNLNLILNDFLSLGRLDEHRISYKPEPLEITEFLNGICSELQLVTRPGQQIIYNHISSERNVFIDKHLLRNIINNLVSNAIKYSDEQSKIEVTSTIEEEILHINVMDEGKGIPESEQEHIFERFYRATNVVNHQGTGLGLNIVKQYVELMKGEITFESIENQGTTFKINFPITSELNQRKDHV